MKSPQPVLRMLNRDNRIAQIPAIDASQTDSPAVLQLAVRLAYLIALVGIVRILFSRRSDDE